MRKTEKEWRQIKRDLAGLISSELPEDPELQVYYDMILNVGMLREDKHDILELRLLNTAFKELRHALRIFKQYRHIPKAAVFGSARTPRDHDHYNIAELFGRKMAKKGWMIITGGASGIMEAAMRGAGAQSSFGLNIMLPFEQDANPIIKGNEKLMFFKYFFTRKLMFLKESEATVLFPGGYGTLDEGFESFTLVQTGKARPRPLLMVDPPGDTFWSSTLSLLKKNMEDRGFISKGDLSLIRHFQDPDEAVDEILGFYKNYHSSRFYRDKYLIRVRKPITAGALGKLNRDFKGMLKSGNFELLTDLSLEDNKDDSLHRLLFHFDRSSYYRLRALIDRLNSL